MSQIITFYSYKGGVGRSMALANVATLLSKWGKRVLMIDWDLEAPGLENFFLAEGLNDVDWSKQEGVLEWLVAKRDKADFKWQDRVIPFKTSISQTELHLLVSGKNNGDYAEKLRDFNLTGFYEEHNGGHIIEEFRDELLNTYDYVLIDSRTGVTDFGGICTIQMPDILVMLFTPTEQALLGTEKIAKRILESHKRLPFDRFRLQIFPVPSRFDSNTEFQESRSWLKRIVDKLKWLYDEWLPTSINRNEFLQIVKVPYISYFSFGEKLPVIEQGVSDPAGLGYAYENLTMLLANRLEDADVFIDQREKYLHETSGQESQAPFKHASISDEIRQVRIYVSYSNGDESLYEDFKNQINSVFFKQSIKFLSVKSIPLGYNKKDYIKHQILKADIVFVLVTNNYFSKLTPSQKGTRTVSPDVIDESKAIEDSQIKILVPIHFHLIPGELPKFISDRKGINLAFGYSSIGLDSALQDIIPLIESKIQEKAYMDLVV